MRLLCSDEQFIERVRRWERSRRVVGLIFFLFGVVAVRLLLYWGHNIDKELMAHFDTPPGATTRELEASLVRAQAAVGFRVEFAFASGIAFATWIAVTGVVFVIYRNRKDRLLLKCWDAQRARE